MVGKMAAWILLVLAGAIYLGVVVYMYPQVRADAKAIRDEKRGLRVLERRVSKLEDEKSIQSIIDRVAGPEINTDKVKQ